jgi:hypothetical protein
MINIVANKNDFVVSVKVYVFPAVFSMEVADDQVFHLSKIRELEL